MATRGNSGITSLFGICGLAVGIATAQAQAQILVYEQTHDGTASDDEFRPTAPAVGVNQVAAVAAGTRYMALYNKGGGLLDFEPFSGMGFPFDLVDSDDHVLIDTRAEYDQVHNRLWVAYLEAAAGTGFQTIDPCANVAFLHLSVSRSPTSIGSLGSGTWWYYTGPGPSGNMAFDLRATGYLAYKNDSGVHRPIEKTARMPSLGFHTPSGERDDREGGVVVAVSGRTAAEGCPVPPSPGSDAPEVNGNTFQHIYIIPYEHDDGEESILDGDQPQPGDITVIRPFETSDISDIAPDDSIYGWVVQEPYEKTQNYEYTRNATFIISTPPGSPETVLQKIRLKGLFYDDTQDPGEEWTLQQRVTATLSQDLDDILLDGSLRYRPTNDVGDYPVPTSLPDTPDPFWGPAAQGTYFHSAVLAKDNGPQGGQYRIFAVHAVRPEFEDRWVAQWYVIDPALSTFHSTPAPSGNWKPSIVASGRLESSGDSYHPTIVVNRQGVAFIDYTYSDNETYPEVRRVRLNSSYTGIASGPTTMKAGPLLAYEENTDASPELGIWANTADTQADPYDQCYSWSTHTLVHDDPVFDPTPTRDVWLFRPMYDNASCAQSLMLVDLNDDGVADTYDALMFSDLYASESRRVDLNGDGQVCPLDMALFQDAYDAVTGR